MKRRVVTMWSVLAVILLTAAACGTSFGQEASPETQQAPTETPVEVTPTGPPSPPPATPTAPPSPTATAEPTETQPTPLPTPTFPPVTPPAHLLSCYNLDSPVTDTIETPTLVEGNFDSAWYWPAYKRIHIGVRLPTSSDATCGRRIIVDSEGVEPVGWQSPLGVPVEQGKAESWTVRYLQGNEDGRTEWSNGLVIEIPAPPDELFIEDNSGTPFIPPHSAVFMTPWCEGATDFGENTKCVITSFVTVRTVP